MTIDMYDLKTLGWDSHFEEQFEPFKGGGYEAGRVALEYQGIYRVYTPRGEVLAEVTGRLRYQARDRADFPAVGDWVALTPQPDGKRVYINAILARKSKFSRKAAGTGGDEQIVATNIDTVFLIQSLDRNYNLRRLERYLVVALESGAAPVIILNKADLVEDAEGKRLEVESVSSGVPVHTISAKKGEGLEQLDRYLSLGVTVAFLGSSGVGKSTLINRLVGKDVQKVQEVRSGDDRGKHTTRHRELVVLPSGGLLIDTPGMRELQLWEAAEGLLDTFTDIEEIAARCYFSNCAHRGEPGCAVKEAIGAGTLDAQRLENYRKMGKEAAFQESRQDQKSQLTRKEKEKRAQKIYRSIKSRKSR